MSGPSARWLGLILTLLMGSAMAQPLRVVVSVAPQAYWVERIAGPRATVEIMVPPGSSPETYAPSPRQWIKLAQAQLYVKVGHPALSLEARHVLPFLRNHPAIPVVDTAAGVELIGSEGSGAHHLHHDIGDTDDHDSSAGDPHLWVSPDTVAVAARHIAKALQQLDPAGAVDYQAGLATFLTDIAALDQGIADKITASPGRAFMVYHPAWGYFARRYGLQQVAIEVEGKEPSPSQLVALIRQGREAGVRAVFVQPGFSRKSAEVVAQEMGATVVEADPLAPDWLANLQRVADAFSAALGVSPH